MTRQQFEELKAEARELHGRTVTFRRAIHEHPELSFAEHETARYVSGQLAAEGISFRPIAGTGILAKIEGRGDLSRCVVLRADMDALPIREQTGLPFASRNEGVMHACGHDMHTACLLGALILLNRRRSEIDGTVFGLFQPGEEVDPGGASLVLSFGRVIADGATNIIPSEVRLEGTFRTMDEVWRAEGKRRIREISAGVAAAYGVEADVDIADGYPCVVNDPELTRRAQRIAAEMWGDERIIPLDLRMTAEDFGYYTERYPSLFFRLGTAGPDGTSGGGLHTGTFNPGEEALDQGAATMAAFGIALLE